MQHGNLLAMQHQRLEQRKTSLYTLSETKWKQAATHPLHACCTTVYTNSAVNI